MAPEDQAASVAKALPYNDNVNRMNIAENTLGMFKKYDPNGRGFISRSLFVEVLKRINLPDVEWLMEVSRILDDGKGNVDYTGFITWILTEEKPPGAVAPAAPDPQTVPEAVSLEIQDIAESLTSMAHSLDSKDHAISNALLKHAATLNALCGVADSGSNLADDASAMPSEYAEDHDALAKLMQHKLKNESEEAAGFREQAAAILERTGAIGSMIDDLQEVPVTEIKDKLAISYWRFCTGLRLYRSETVTQALRLICSAPVPGLGKTSYLDVFQALTESAAWENHIYLFGGLVRDILRRQVGNDIDIGFSAPAAELDEICKAHGYTCSLDGDYILIGDDAGEEYLEGMVISFNGIQPPEHADFSMNTLFYDFKNDVLIDKTGIAIPAVIANRCDLPCPSDRWKSWLDINGVRVCFRFYKFLMRGYGYHDSEMAFVVKSLLDYWSDDPDHTVEVGRIALGNLVSTTSTEKVEKLRQLVELSYGMLQAKASRPKLRKRASMHVSALSIEAALSSNAQSSFLTVNQWWRKGWLHLLKLSPDKALA